MKNTYQNNSFTKFPNRILDEYLAKLSGSEWLVLSVIIRKTIGFHKQKKRISLRHFEKVSGLTRNTVKSSIDGLVEKQIIDRIPYRNSFKYSLKRLPAKNDPKVDGTNFDLQLIYPVNGSKIEPETVQDLNALKETTKETEKNTTSSIDEPVIDLLMAWNSRFEQKIELFDVKMINHIRAALQKFSFEDIISAMDNRLKADYYRTRKPELLHNPKCFFPYPDTIRSDFKRGLKKLLTYEKKNSWITEKGHRDLDFRIRWDHLDDRGRPMWEFLG